MEESQKEKKRDWAGQVVLIFRIGYLLAGVIVFFRILTIMFFYTPNEKLLKMIKPKSEKHTIEAIRGSIYSHDNKLLASSVPSYQIYMDCSVRRDYYRKDKKNGENNEKEWRKKAKDLSVELSNFFGDKSANDYYKFIINNREKNNKYVKIGRKLSHIEFLTVKKFPLFRERSYIGGFIPESFDSRQYPYEGMARRVIGYVKNNTDIEGNIKGIEGSYNAYLHGNNGTIYLKKTDDRGKIIDIDSTSIEVQHGYDIKTTLNVSFQDIADKALRRLLEEYDYIRGACAIVMDVKTGAIRTMANINRNEKDNSIGETINYAITEIKEPGSVFKAATLMTLLEDKKIELTSTVPTFNGKWRYAGKLFEDEYLEHWKTDTISVLDGFKVSSNNVFRYLACLNYEDDPERYVDKLYEYKIFENFDFDIKGLRSAIAPKVGDKSWSGTSLPSIAIGYSAAISPLQTVSFYNAIANKGKFMKPYLVEEIIDNGEVIRKTKPTILNGSICSKRTIKDVSYALRQVVEGGTGRGLKDLDFKIAGKTGTARMLIDYERNGKHYSSYVDPYGHRAHQASFAGFFPYEDPKYTAIVVVYGKKGGRDIYGSQYALPVFKEIAQNIYITDGSWRKQIKVKDNDIR